MPNLLATVLDTCSRCGARRLVQPSRIGRVCKPCHNKEISRIPRSYRDRPCEHCGRIIESAHPKQKWCKVCCPNATASRRLREFGISQPEFDDQKNKQGNLCAICKVNPPTDLAHNHETGEIRELLCAWCNHGLAYMEDEKWKANAEIYLEKNSKENGHSMDAKAV
jgi:hypothetical protein